MWRKLFKGHDAQLAAKEAEEREKNIRPTIEELRLIRKDNHVYRTIYSTLRER